MNRKELMQKYSPEELAEAMVFPVTLTKQQEKEAQKKLAAHRLERKQAMTIEEKLQLKLMQLKYRLEDYVYNDHYNPEYTFGYFLEQYLKLTNQKKKEFAYDIQVHKTLLSNIMSNRREPNEAFFVRLELHSNNTIPAIDWFKLIEKEKEHTIKTNSLLRENESRYVIKKLPLFLERV